MIYQQQDITVIKPLLTPYTGRSGEDNILISLEGSMHHLLNLHEEATCLLPRCRNTDDAFMRNAAHEPWTIVFQLEEERKQAVSVNLCGDHNLKGWIFKIAACPDLNSTAVVVLCC